MTNDKALFAWFDAFCRENFLGCYVSTAVPSTVDLPYLTYEYNSASMGDTAVPITVSIWARTSSEAKMNEYAEKLRQYIKTNDYIKTDMGVIYVYPGTPFAVAQTDSEDIYIKLRSINIVLDFCTE